MEEPKQNQQTKPSAPADKARQVAIDKMIARKLQATINARKVLAAIVASLVMALPGEAMPTRCPFVDDAGMPCMGIPIPVGMNPAGGVYECSYGHRWIEAN